MNHHHRPMPLPRPMPLHHAPNSPMYQNQQHFASAHQMQVRLPPMHSPRSPKSQRKKAATAPMSPSSPSRKISKFCPCSAAQKSLITQGCVNNGKMEILILKGGLPKNELLYIQQHCQYQVRTNDKDLKQPILLATIPVHFQMPFNFNTVAVFTQWMVNHQFIRFRNSPITQTRGVSLWRIYKFGGEQTLFNIWIVAKAAERALGTSDDRSTRTKKSKKKKKNYHLSAHQTSTRRADSLGEDVMKKIFSFVSGPIHHSWIHIRETAENMFEKSNLVGLEFNANTR